jgi:hypothetical protein
MRGGGDGLHVVHGAGAVVDVREHQHGHFVGEHRRALQFARGSISLSVKPRSRHSDSAM